MSSLALRVLGFGVSHGFWQVQDRDILESLFFCFWVRIKRTQNTDADPGASFQSADLKGSWAGLSGDRFHVFTAPRKASCVLVPHPEAPDSVLSRCSCHSLNRFL